MRWLLLVTVLLLAAPAPASATSCVFGPFVTSTPALGCDVVVWAYAGYAPDGPRVEVYRDGQWLDVAGDMTVEQQPLSVAYPDVDCDGRVTETTYQQHTFDIYRVKLAGAQVGDTLYVDGQLQGEITSGGCIDASPPDVSCGVTQHCDLDDEQDDDDEIAGCQAGGDTGGALAFALLGLAAWRRRRGVRTS